MKYVTFDESGNLTGAYIQDLHTDHEFNHIQVSDTEYRNWTAYKANVERNGLDISDVIVLLPTLEDYDAALTAHLDSVAQSRRYADRISCAVRAGYPGPFQADGIAFATWMDECNAIGYTMLAEFQQGLIPQPTIAEMIAALPVMVWP